MKTLSLWLKRILAAETLSMAGIAILVGLVSGAGVWLFKRLIDLFHFMAFSGLGKWLSPLGGWSVAVLPALGGLIVGLIVHFLVGSERIHGTAGVMESVALAGGRLRYRRAPAKALAAALSIGSGASVGPEDPSVQIGANLGSMFGQWLHLSDDRVRTLVSAGAASGIAAAFNAPIAGVFFALEIVLGEIGSGALGTIVIAAVVSAVFTQAVSGTQPAFPIPAYSFNSVWELPLYLGLGLLAGPISAIFTRSLYFAQDAFHSWRVPDWVRTAAAGLLVGLTGIFLPRIFGVGYDTIGEVLNKNDLAIGLLVLLLVAKIVLTSTSLGGGFVGGVFAPSLFIGAVLGSAFGWLSARLFPGLNINPSAFALVGMAAVMAGTAHAPLTAILLLFEMTNDYRIILPLMFAVAVSLLVSQRLQRDSVYMLGLKRQGIRLDRGRDVEVLQTITVAEAMHKNIRPLSASLPLAKAVAALARTRSHGAAVVDKDGDLVGVLTLQDIDRAYAEGRTRARVGAISVREPQVAYPDEALSVALQRMSRGDFGRLPVVERENPHKLLGMLNRADVIHSYDIALNRRAAQRHQVHQASLDALTPEQVNVSEVVVETGSACAGKKMKEIAWPAGSIIASLRRGARVVIPRGETVIRAGDVLVVVTEGKNKRAVLDICRDQN
ncbi:MAG TPA: chloride channel protein [Anaerolineales bacterium]|nr:chloride channel protein [Anaerolineales bacterium]